MRHYGVRISVESFNDLARIRKYITDKYSDPISAERIVQGILNKCKSLKYLPRRSSVFIVIADLEILRIHFGKYTIMYCIHEKEALVEVLAVINSRRNLESAIKERMGLD